MVGIGKNKEWGSQMKYILVLLVLLGCAKSAPQSATEAALQQTHAIHQQIKKECPTAQIDEPIKALTSMINNQLASCESETGRLRERNNTLTVIIIGIVLLWGVSKFGKIKSL